MAECSSGFRLCHVVPYVILDQADWAWALCKTSAGPENGKSANGDSISSDNRTCRRWSLNGRAIRKTQDGPYMHDAQALQQAKRAEQNGDDP